MSRLLENRKRKKMDISKFKIIGVTLIILFLLIFISLMVYLSQKPGQWTSSYIIQKPYISKIVSKVIPENMIIHYADKIISNQEVINYSEKFSGGSTSSTVSSNAMIIISFNGERIQLIGNYGPINGIGNIYIDDNRIGTVDLYSSIAKRLQVLFESSFLEPGDHILRIEASGKRNEESSGTVMVLDVVNIWNKGTEIRLENVDTNIQYINSNYDYYYQFIIRKLAHALVYFIITCILISIALLFRIRKIFVPFVIVVVTLFAVIDEYSQSFVEGRHPHVTDVIIDICGSVMAILIFTIYNLIIINTRNSRRKKIEVYQHEKN